MFQHILAFWIPLPVGNWTIGASGAFISRSGTINSYRRFIDRLGAGTGRALYNVVINSTGTKALGAALDINGDLTITAGTLDVSSSGDWTVYLAASTNAGTFVPRMGTVVFEGASAIIRTGGGISLYNVTVDTAGTVALDGDIIIGGTFTIASGTFDCAGYDMYVGGSWINNGTFLARTGTVYSQGLFANNTILAGASSSSY